MITPKAMVRPKAKLWPKAMIRPKAKFWPEAGPVAMLWPEAMPEAKFWPKAGPEAMLRPKANNGKLFLLIALMMASFTPSRNILQSLQNWKDISEYVGINLELLKFPNQKKFGANHAPLETKTTINARRQQSFRWDTIVCSFATIQKALHSLFELG
jgi:hypothetical protein